jgi:hypothetical protein
MGSKNDPGKFDCYANAMPDEPMFVLLGRDPYAPYLLDQWADHRERDVRLRKRPEADFALCREARHCADNMREWRKANDGAWRKGS